VGQLAWTIKLSEILLTNFDRNWTGEISVPVNEYIKFHFVYRSQLGSINLTFQIWHIYNRQFISDLEVFTTIIISLS
jgi:hypothetical protein